MVGTIAVASGFEQGCCQLGTGQLADAVATFTLLIEQDPLDWQSLANRALAHYQLAAYDLAFDDYYRALQIQPMALQVQTNFAVLLKELGQLDVAENLLRQVLQVAPDQVDAWSNLGIVLECRMQYAEAEHCHRQAIALAGPNPARLTNLGNTLTLACRPEQAVQAYQQALQLDTGFASARYNQSIPLFMLGRYAEAWPCYEARWQTILTPRFTERRWRGEPLGTATLLLWSEQGLGDSLQMARFLPLIRQRYPAATLLLSCPASLHCLFGQIEGLTLLAADVEPAHDWQIPLASLPAVFLIEREEQLPRQPYLRADPQRVAMWDGQLLPRRPGRQRIGLVWQSGVWGVGVRDLTRQRKSVDVSLLQPLFALADVICLQPEPVADELRDQLQTPQIKDFADTAALVVLSDHVVSVDTAVAHLAGAMGHPVTVLMRHEGAPFFGLQQTEAPWYPGMRVLRQSAPGDWTTVLAALPAVFSPEELP